MFQDLYNYLYHQDVTGGIPLKGTGIMVGLALIAVHVWAWLKRREAQAFLQTFPRNYFWGVALLSVGFVWGMMALSYMDMGEFYFLRSYMLTIVPIAFVLVITYVREFLAVRALGCLMLLIAGIVLEAAYLKPPMSRLLLPVLAYVWIIAGMFFVGTPYVMRDGVTWVTTKQSRWSAAALGGLAYGAVVLLVAVVDW